MKILSIVESDKHTKCKLMSISSKNYYLKFICFMRNKLKLIKI